MIVRTRRALVSLQGKLTLSYVLVTVLTTVVMQVLLLLGFVVYGIYSSFIPNVLVDVAGAIANDLHNGFRGRATDAQVLERIYRRRSTSNEGTTFTVEPARDGEIRGDLLVTLIDMRGMVITSSQPLSYTTDRPYTERMSAVEQDVVQHALNGVTDRAHLGAWLRPSNIPIAAYPIFDEAGALSGAVYIRSVAPIAWPGLSEFAFLIGVSALGFTCAAALAGTLFGYLTARPFVYRLAGLRAATSALAAGNLGQRVEDSSNDEIGQLGQQFNLMAEQLEQTVRSLRLMAERNAQLAEQARQLAVVEERNRLARDLHDSVSQQLFSITMLAAAARSLTGNAPQQAEEHLTNLQATAQQALHEARVLIRELRPAALNSQGLGHALREHVQAFQRREQLKTELQLHDERRLPLAYELALFRIVQEALANVARHARASRVSVELRYSAGQVDLEISDDGIGFVPGSAQRPGAVGLSSMTERAHELGGSLTIAAPPGQGTRVRARLPVLDDIRVVVPGNAI